MLKALHSDHSKRQPGSGLQAARRARRVSSHWLWLALAVNGCHDVDEYGLGARCGGGDACRRPLVCHSGHCIFASDAATDTGGAANGTGGINGYGGMASEAGGTSGAASMHGTGGTQQVAHSTLCVGGVAPSTTRNTSGDAGCTPSSTIRKLAFGWLGRSCGAVEQQDVVFTLNEVEVARVPLPKSCECTPGVGRVQVTDPALLAVSVNGVNTFRATTTGELSWATVTFETAQFGGEVAIWAAWPFPTWDDATSHPENLCEVGVQAILSLSGVAMELGGGVNCH